MQETWCRDSTKSAPKFKSSNLLTFSARSLSSWTDAPTSLIVLRLKKRAVFVHGFAKSDAANIEPRLLRALKALAPVYLGMTEAQVELMIDSGELTEVEDAEEN